MMLQYNKSESGVEFPLRFKYLRMICFSGSFYRKSFHLENAFPAISGYTYQHILKNSTLFHSQSLYSYAFFGQNYNLHNTKQRTKAYLQTDYTHLTNKVCECIYNRSPKDRFLPKQFEYHLGKLKRN